MRDMPITISVTGPDEIPYSYEYETSTIAFFAEDCLAIRVRDADKRSHFRILRVRNDELPRHESEVGGYTPTVSDLVRRWLTDGNGQLGVRGSDLAQTPVEVRRGVDGWMFL